MGKWRIKGDERGNKKWIEHRSSEVWNVREEVGHTDTESHLLASGSILRSLLATSHFCKVT